MEEKKLKDNKIFDRGFIIITSVYVIFLILFGLTINEASKSNLIQERLINPLKEYNLLQKKNIENEKLMEKLISPNRNKRTTSKNEPTKQQTSQQPAPQQKTTTNQNLTIHYEDNNDSTEPSNQNTPKKEPEEVKKCHRVEIEEEGLKSNKCYSWDDYSKLQKYLFELNRYKSLRDSAEKRIKMTCGADTESAKEFFKDSCEDAKDDKKEAENKINEYKGKIREMISKGWD
jgi:FtsZ-interacting cell division protein ZipA